MSALPNGPMTGRSDESPAHCTGAPPTPPAGSPKDGSALNTGASWTPYDTVSATLVSFKNRSRKEKNPACACACTTNTNKNATTPVMRVIEKVLCCFVCNTNERVLTEYKISQMLKLNRSNGGKNPYFKPFFAPCHNLDQSKR